MEPFDVFRPDAGPTPARRVGRHLRGLLEWVGLRRILVAVAVAASMAAGGWWLLRAPDPGVEQRLPVAAGVLGSGPVPTGSGAVDSGAAPSAPQARGATGVSALVVHVAGAVQRPGLVTVLAGARVADVIRAAGGPLPDADIDALNLAAFVTDAGRVYVPREGEAVEVPAVVGTPDANGVPLRIDLNVATAAELDRLPGIGPSLAAAVIAYRNTNGPFRSVDALLKVPGIGPAKLEQFRALVRV